MKALVSTMRDEDRRMLGSGDESLTAISAALQAGLNELTAAMEWLLDHSARDPAQAAAGAVPFLKLAGTVIGGWLLMRGAHCAVTQIAEGSSEADFLSGKVHVARHYMAHVMVEAAGLSRVVTGGAQTTLALADHQF